MFDQLRTALRYTLLEIARNRLAAGLLIIFVPLWYYLLGTLIGDAPVAFKYGLSNRFLQVDGHNLTLITTGLNTVTLIMAFLFFASTRGSAAFDQRLVRSGYRQATLMLAKASALVVASAVIAAYALGVLMVAWRPRGLFLIWLSFFLAGLIYGALGLLLGALLRSELAGFFIIIMVSLFDTLFQNPLDNPAANQDALKALPSYAPTQVGVAGGFTSLFPGRELLLSLAWFAVLIALGLAIFWLRTRSWNARPQPLTPPALVPTP
jgi:ABC-2 type transport system permease protein